MWSKLCLAGSCTLILNSKLCKVRASYSCDDINAVHFALAACWESLLTTTREGSLGKSRPEWTGREEKNTLKQPVGRKITRVSEIWGGGRKKIDHLHSFNRVKSKNKKKHNQTRGNTHGMQKMRSCGRLFSYSSNKLVFTATKLKKKKCILELLFCQRRTHVELVS